MKRIEKLMFIPVIGIYWTIQGDGKVAKIAHFTQLAVCFLIGYYFF